MLAVEPLGDPELTAAQKANLVGVCAEMWGEQIGPSNALTRIFPRVLAAAEVGWSGPRSERGLAARADESTLARFQALACTLNRRGVPTAHIRPGHCRFSMVQ